MTALQTLGVYLLVHVHITEKNGLTVDRNKTICTCEYNRNVSYAYGAYFYHISRVSYQKGPICHASAWRVGPFWQDTLDVLCGMSQYIQLNNWNACKM